MTQTDNAWRVNARLRAALRSAAKPACAGSRKQSANPRFWEAAQAAFVAEPIGAALAASLRRATP
jgi:hypothetical protein